MDPNPGRNGQLYNRQGEVQGKEVSWQKTNTYPHSSPQLWTGLLKRSPLGVHYSIRGGEGGKGVFGVCNLSEQQSGDVLGFGTLFPKALSPKMLY